MTFSQCGDCGGVQIAEKINADEMFKNYFYFSSQIKTLQNHFQEHAKYVVDNFIQDKGTASVLEFGSNDGVLLRPLVSEGVAQVIGVDPAENVVQQNQVDGAHQIVGYFNENLAEELLKNYGKQDLILANNCYAHINDINSTTKAVQMMLKEDGLFVFEVHHLLKLIDELQFDMIYHEHIYYYSVIFLLDYFKKFSLKIYKVDEINIHAGSIRVYVCKDDSPKYSNEDPSVQHIISKEKLSGVDDYSSLKNFSGKVENFKEDLLSLMNKIKSNGEKVIGYGASGRANTILQYCNLDENFLDYIIDDSPPKQGFFTPGTNIEIVDNQILNLIHMIIFFYLHGLF